MEHTTDFFVTRHSIVRTIWGNADAVLFIFAGASAEFALNKAVDWLYFTGRLPADPLGRLFSTVNYAGMIVFSETAQANAAIDKITSIHSVVEQQRDSKIPDWAYRDVLYMLIFYSIASFELLQRKMTTAEKNEVYDVFYRVGIRMGLKALPKDYATWVADRELHLFNDLVKSSHTTDLYRQYKKHLGSIRFFLLLESQKMVLPPTAKDLLGLKKNQWLKPIVPVYRLIKYLHGDRLVKAILLPKKYRQQVNALDRDH